MARLWKWVGGVTVLVWMGLSWGEPPPHPPAGVLVSSPVTFPGQPVGELVVVQPALHQWDYQSPRTLRSALEPSFQLAGVATRPRITVLPEYLGSWLVASGAPDLAFSLDNNTSAMGLLVLLHPLDFLESWRNRAGPVPLSLESLPRFLFLMRREEILSGLDEVVGGLARDYHTWIVVGGTLLPHIQPDGHFQEGSLYNSALVYDEGGVRVAQWHKTYPIDAEKPFLDTMPTGQPGTIPTPLGALGALVCADSWYPDSYRRLSGARVVMVGAFLSPASSWDEPWPGYNGFSAPADVDGADVGTLTEGQAWERYSLISRIRLSGSGFGGLAYAAGDLWDLSAGGDSALIQTTSSGEVVVTRVGRSGVGGVILGEIPLPEVTD